MLIFKNISLILVSVIILILISANFPLNNASALMMSPVSQFGGRIKNIIPCIKPPGLILTVGPPKGGQFFLSVNSKIYNYGVIMPGVWVLGSAIPAPVVCKGLKKNVGGFKLTQSPKMSYSFFETAYALSAPPVGGGEIDIIGTLSGGKSLSMLGIAFPKILGAIGIKIGSFSSDDLKKLNAGGGIIMKIGTSRF